MSTEGQCFACDTPEALAMMEHLPVVAALTDLELHSANGFKGGIDVTFSLRCSATIRPEDYETVVSALNFFHGVMYLSFEPGKGWT